MPPSEEILSGLEGIASNWRNLAAVWHGYFGAVLLGLIFGVRPGMRILGMLLALPLLSVAALAWASGNPLNGTVFAVLGASLLAICFSFPSRSVQLDPPWMIVAGGLMVVFGWTYPHFLDARSSLSYLYAAPTGLIPCPTLSVILGFTLVLSGLDSRSWLLILGAAGNFYGAFGAWRLGVMVDIVLLVGSLLTLFAAFSRTSGIPIEAGEAS